MDKYIKYISIGEASKILEVSISTLRPLRRWKREGKISFIRTSGNQRRYNAYTLSARLYGSKNRKSRKNRKNQKLLYGVKKAVWTCPNCATGHDRDVNAAITLKNIAVTTVLACGEMAQQGRSMKQELNVKPTMHRTMGRFE